MDINRDLDAVLSTLGDEGYEDEGEYAREDGGEDVNVWGRRDEGENEEGEGEGEGDDSPLFITGAGWSMADVPSDAAAIDTDSEEGADGGGDTSVNGAILHRQFLFHLEGKVPGGRYRPRESEK